MLKKLTLTAACGVLASMAMATTATGAGNTGKIAKGRTGQGRSIRLEVGPRQVVIQSFSIELRCSGGYVLVDQESGFLPSSVNRKGMIRDRQFGSTDEVLLRGRVYSNTVRGKIRVRDRLGKHRCSSPWVAFTAHR